MKFWLAQLNALVCLVLLATSFATEAQQPGKAATLGVLYPNPVEPRSTRPRAFFAALGELGWIEGQNLIVQRRNADTPDRLPILARELVDQRPDVILTSSTPAALALKHATSTIPIVVAAVADPVETGLITSMRRPGGNITGFSSFASELNPKRLQLLTEVAPKISRVGVLANPNNPASVTALRDVRTAAERLKLELLVVEIERPEDLDAALTRLAGLKPQALLVHESMLRRYRERIAGFALQHRLPSAFGYPEHADAGGLLAYSPNYDDLWRRAAVYVDKILKGAKPESLPFEQATKFELIINGRTAKALGLKIPQSILMKADKVIE